MRNRSSLLVALGALSILAAGARADDGGTRPQDTHADPRGDTQGGDSGGTALPVISGGREKEMLALAMPYALGSEIAPGWHLENVTASETAVRYVVLGPNEAKVGVRLEHPKRAPSSETTPSFAVHREIEKQAGKAPADPRVLDALVEAIRKNDNGKFWPAKGPSDRRGDGRVSDGKGDSHRTDQTAEVASAPLPLRRIVLVAGLLVVLAALMVSRRKKPEA